MLTSAPIEVNGWPQAHGLHAPRLILDLSSAYHLLGDRTLLSDTQTYSGLTQRTPWVNLQGVCLYQSQLVGRHSHFTEGLENLRFIGVIS